MIDSDNPQPGEIWEMRPPVGPPWKCRIQGMSKTDPGWVRVREIGGKRSRATYSPEAFKRARLIS